MFIMITGILLIDAFFAKQDLFLRFQCPSSYLVPIRSIHAYGFYSLNESIFLRLCLSRSASICIAPGLRYEIAGPNF